MIKVRLSALSKDGSNSFEAPIKNGSLLDVAIKDLFSNRPEIVEAPEDVIKVTVNGLDIPKDMWPVTSLKDTDTVLISPKLKSGDSSGLFRTAIILVAAALAPGVGLAVAPAGFAANLAGAAFVALATYTAFQLIPPPVPNNSGVGSSDYSSSQMYSITSQANAVKKFGSVPKVYGKHRIFPVVAATPYVELEVDPATKQLVQYFYAIYDFGFGPNVISDLKIGNTGIENFTEVTYNLVDPNKPLVDEGDWDAVTKSEFSIYRGDVSSENMSIELNGNRDAGSPLSEYEVIRNAGSNPDLKSQEIALNFILPRGLYGISSTGVQGERTVVFDIHFSKVGENVWRGASDPAYVNNPTAIGGDTQLTPNSITYFNPPSDPTDISFGTLQYALDYVQPTSDWSIVEVRNLNNLFELIVRKRTYFLGYSTGSTYIDVPIATTGLNPGDDFLFEGEVIGTIQSTSNINGTTKRVTLASPITRPLLVWKIEEREEYDQYAPPGSGDLSYQVVGNSSTTNRFYRRTPNIDKFRMTASDTSTVFAMFKFTPKVPGEYKVRITRIYSYSTYTTSIADEVTLTNITTRTDTAPIVTDKRHAFLELRIKASGQLNGTIQNLSAICSSVLNTYNGTSWELKETNNPAWVFNDILTGQVNKRPLALSRIDADSLLEWADFCDEIPTNSLSYFYTEKRYQCNFVLDFDTTVQYLLQQVGSAAQASLNLVDGKYGVLLDKKRTTPVQLFTPRNSRDFASNRSYTPKPHAVKVSYVDPESDWQQKEVVVYDTGYDAVTATEFDSLSTFATTNVEQALRFGRYFVAQNKLRQELMSLKVDFEYLVCTRGDFVQISQDVMKVGGTPARVKKVTGNQVVVDEGLEIDIMLNYGYTYRSATGQILTNTLSVVSADTFDLDGSIPAVGDLIIIGEVGSIVFDCIVKSIIPDGDLSATITLVEKADAIYDIDELDFFPSYDPQISATSDPDFSPPGEVEDLQVIDNSYLIKSNGYEYYVTTDWEAPAGAGYELFEIHVDSGKGYVQVGTTEDSTYRYIVDEDNLGVEHKFKVLAVSATGKKLTLGEVGFVTATPLEKSTPPSDVIPFNSDITGETIQLFWTRIVDADVKEYIIRYSPSLTGTWETSTVLQRVSSNTTLIATQARTGIYMIKAVDFAGNESANATAVRTTIPNLNGLNIIEELDDFPALLGTKDRIETLGGDTLVLQQAVVGPPGSEQYYSEGYYYYEDLLDLGDIYTVRLQSLIQAEGLVSTDIMSNWNPLSSVLSLYSPGSADWDVEAEYRAADSLNVMSAWTTLDSIATLNEGNTDNFSPWRKFIIGDATGRIFQFRLKLISNVLSVTPRVISGTIRADMPDRLDSYPNLTAPDTGLTVTYDPAFKGPGTSPNVQITLENGQSGDYWQYTSKTLEGFTVVFYDKNNNAVSRQFDAQVKGYGKRSTASI